MLATDVATRSPPFPTSAAADQRESDWDRLTLGGRDACERLAVIAGRRDLDAHAHVFHAADGAVPGSRYAPGHDATAAAWSLHLLSAGLIGGTLVQPSFLGTDNGRMLDAMRTGRERGLLVTGSAVVPLDAAPRYLEQLAAAGCVSLRLNLMKLPLPDFASREWDAFTANARATGLAIEIHLDTERSATLAGAILDAGCTVIVDHYGLAPDVAALEAILSAGDASRTFVKASAPYRLPHRDDPAGLARRLQRCAEEMVGEANMMWGSDWPHTQHAVTFSESLDMNGGPGLVI